MRNVRNAAQRKISPWTIRFPWRRGVGTTKRTSGFFAGDVKTSTMESRRRSGNTGSRLASIYLSVYHSRPASKNSVLAPINDETWPYDRGDDPSFFARLRAGKKPGPLTWGICRGDVRNKIKKDDVVVFFSKRETQNGDEYSLSAIATVEEKLKHTEATDPKNGFANYYNLLVRPLGQGNRWEHFEPPRNGPRGHSDWIWRIVERRGQSRNDFVGVERVGYFDDRTAVNGQRLVKSIASNYVVFSNSRRRSFILGEPIPIAHRDDDIAFEKWYTNYRSVEIMRLTVGLTKGKARRSLRIDRIRNAHPHIRVVTTLAEVEAWRTRFFELLEKLGVQNLV